ncbi:DUF2243 domain-containing protein [Bordetella sp. 15P40C-2]|uniref:DUF2243 domain-containing protein n=1 Tax=Bordetella sp. 15P40C-2 TaxID=2572246 RepID=UPI00351B5414
MSHATAAENKKLRWAGVWLGFAMGGFFDGILLHQILQWHHLLSAIQTGALGSLRMQVTIDGWFHALMYVIAAIGLWNLYLYRSTSGKSPDFSVIWPRFWMGFGVWHIIDAVFSHWITGIHRIKMDSSMPLAWDLAWVVVFGIVPFMWGWRRRDGGSGTPGATSAKAVRVMSLFVLFAGAVNIFPLRGNDDTTVVALGSHASVPDFFAALDTSEASVIWTAGQGEVWVVQGLSLRARLALYQAGAVYVSGTAAPAGCAAWLQSGPRLSRV